MQIKIINRELNLSKSVIFFQKLIVNQALNEYFIEQKKTVNG